MARLLVFAVLLIFVSTHDAVGQGSNGPAGKEAVTPGVEAKVDRIFDHYNGEDRPGVAVLVMQDGEVLFERGYGAANLEYGIPITPSSVFHVASVSKQFTAFAMVLLEQQGKLSMDDEIRTHLPELPDFGEPITIRHLIHHTSGLRDQWTLWTMAGGRMDDVITQEDLFGLIHHQRELNFSPGAAYTYSNSGYMLMAEIVERVTGSSFREWMREHVFEPLEMHDTQVYDDHERIVKDRAYSYRPGGEGTYRKAVLSYANAGATSLFTTTRDLARWLENFDHGRVGGAQAIAKMRERGVLTTGDTLSYAFGLMVDSHGGLDRLQHGGADAGYRSFVAYYPEIDAGVVMLSNLATFNRAAADEVAEVFFSEHMREEAASSEGEFSFSPERFDDYAGRYASDDGTPVMYLRLADRYFEKRSSSEPRELTPTSDSTFTYAEGEATVTFHRSAEGVERVTVEEGAARELRRLPPNEPTTADLEAYAGSYYSPELETYYHLEVDEGRLVARHRRHGETDLAPVEKDLFRGDAWYFNEILFERAETGAVEGLRVTSERVHNLWFERVEP